MFHIGGGASCSIRTLAERVARRAASHFGEPVSVEVPSSRGPVVAHPVDFRIDRLESLGYAPTDRLDEETERTLRLLEGRAA
jgi:nucleoside-diphosphate-sugar epimerase